jgi:hypothetical protein
MSDQTWIVIPRWDEFQHYKDRDPKWIKDHRRQYDDEAFLNLTFHQRGILQGLRHAYAASNRQISDSTLTLTRRLGQRVTTRDLAALNHAGFIEFSASKPLAIVVQPASPELETEKETDTKKEQVPPAPASPPRLRVADPVWDFVVELEGEPLASRKPARGRIVKELKQRLNEQDIGEARRRHDALAREWGDAKATARALVEHWDRAGRMADGLMRPAQAQPRTDGKLTPSEIYASTLRPERPEPDRRLELDAG